MTTNSVQSTYTAAFTSGFPGMIASSRERSLRSRTVEDAAGLALGAPAFRGAGDRGVTGTVSAAFIGVVAAQHDAQGVPGATTADTIRQYQSAAILDEGDIWINSSTAAADGETVYVTAAKAYSNVSTGNTALPARFLDTISVAGLVRIEVIKKAP